MLGAASATHGAARSVLLGAPLGERDTPRYVCVLRPRSCGWGTLAPGYLTLGGVPSGVIKRIRWMNWGGPTAYGIGESWTYAPGGGYYSEPVRVQLRAYSIGRCAPRHTIAYRRLVIRKQIRPGGRFDHWSGFSTSGSNWICGWIGEGRKP